MKPWGVLVGTLLAAIGAVLVVALLAGVGLPESASTAVQGDGGLRPVLAVTAGLAMASGMTLLGLALGHWRRPLPPGPELSRTPDTRE
jgi:hypothetical protein